jgi:hypothetical protein
MIFCKIRESIHQSKKIFIWLLRNFTTKTQLFSIYLKLILNHDLHLFNSDIIFTTDINIIIIAVVMEV